MSRWVFLIATAMPAVATAQQAPPAAAVPSPGQAPQAVAPLVPTAQTPPPSDEQAEPDEPEVIVRGTRGLPGSVIGDIPPEQQLGPADIRTYGVNSVAELLTELAPQTRSGRGSGQPVVLLNGRRIASFGEISNLPTEAIARIDILPEEVALKYGYRADQRVVNFVLRQRFNATTVEAGNRITTQGDRNQPELELDYLTIRRDRRFNLHSSYRQNDAVLEAERDVLASGTVDQRPFRTLLGQSRNFSTNATYARNVLGNIGATLNGRIEAQTGRSLQGLPTVSLTVPTGSPFVGGGSTVVRTVGGEALQQRNATITSRVGTTFNGDLGRWRWSLIGGYDRVDGRTVTQAGVDATAFQARLNANDPSANPNGALALPRLADNRAISLSQNVGVDAQANGTLFALPAGEVATSLSLGGDLIDFSSRSTRAGVTTRGAVARDQASARINVDLPISNKAREVLGAIGTLSVNVNARVDELSDFGTLTTYGYGANWAPIEAVRLIASVTEQDGAPSPQQLGNPVIVTPNVRLFDFVTGTTANVTTVSGGNPALRGFSTHTLKLGATIRPSKDRDLTFIANYVGAHVDDPVAGFPAATSEIAGAFPGRFSRDGNGQLFRVDTRPVNFARTQRSELRYGFNFSVPLKSQLQRQIEAFRAGTGPNPFAGLRLPGQRGPNAGAGGQPPAGAAPPTGATPSAGAVPGTPPSPEGAPPAAGQGNRGGFGGFGPGGGFGGGGQGGGPGGGGGGFRGGGGGFGGGAGGRGGQGGGRLQFALYHTWHFTDRVIVADAGPRLDLLNGDAIGSGGGQPRHELEGQAGYANNGLGARLSVNWRSATAVTGGTAAVPTQLDFGSLSTTNLRVFFDAGQRLDLIRKRPWLRGVRIALGVDNLFDARQRVRDASGTTPVNYQPDLLDPLGRTVRLSIRKLFF